MENQTVNVDALVNNAKRSLNGVIDQLYDIISQINKENGELRKQIEALRKPPINLGEFTPLSDQK